MLILEIAAGIAFGVVLIPWAYRCVEWTAFAVTDIRYRLRAALTAFRPWVWWWAAYLLLCWLGTIYGPKH